MSINNAGASSNPGTGASLVSDVSSDGSVRVGTGVGVDVTFTVVVGVAVGVGV